MILKSGYDKALVKEICKNCGSKNVKKKGLTTKWR